MNFLLICSAEAVRDRKCVYVCLRMCEYVYMCMVGAVRAAQSQIWGGLQECSLPLKSLLSVLNKYQVQNEGNVASQGSIQPCFIKGSRSLFHPAASVVVGGDEEGTYILMRWAGLEAGAQRDILLQSKHTNQTDWVQDDGITMKLWFVAGMLFFCQGNLLRFSLETCLLYI